MDIESGFVSLLWLNADDVRLDRRPTAIITQHRPDPVSYTHLDVYKRQAHAKKVNFEVAELLLELMLGVPQ